MICCLFVWIRMVGGVLCVGIMIGVGGELVSGVGGECGVGLCV